MRRHTAPKVPISSRWRRLAARINASAPTFVVAIPLLLPLALIVAVLPWPMVLPVFSLWAIAAAGLAALIAALRRVQFGAGVTAWDVAGAFTLIGCAAAIFGEIENMLAYVQPLPSRNELND